MGGDGQSEVLSLTKPGARVGGGSGYLDDNLFWHGTTCYYIVLLLLPLRSTRYGLRSLLLCMMEPNASRRVMGLRHRLR